MTPGNQTSEYKLTVLALILGTVADGFAGVVQQLQIGGVNASWFAIALVVSATVAQIAGLFGYQKSRTLLKLADAAPAATALPAYGSGVLGSVSAVPSPK